MKASTLRRGMNLWPPFLFAGIRVLTISDDYRRVEVRLRRHMWNQNYVGTHFGGSLFAMTDPFWMVLLIHRLGPGFMVWDKAAEIEFVTPGRGDVFARFDLTDERVGEIQAAAEKGKTLPWFDTEVTTADGTVVARIRKQVYVRHKAPARALV